MLIFSLLTHIWRGHHGQAVVWGPLHPHPVCWSFSGSWGPPRFRLRGRRGDRVEPGRDHHRQTHPPRWGGQHECCVLTCVSWPAVRVSRRCCERPRPQEPEGPRGGVSGRGGRGDQCFGSKWDRLSPGGGRWLWGSAGAGASWGESVQDSAQTH